MKVKLSPDMPCIVQRGSRGIAPLILNLDTGWGWVVNATPLWLFPLVEGAGWASRLAWTDVGKRKDTLLLPEFEPGASRYIDYAVPSPL
jgi:hypothetical protein